jgi:hypothetical protein
LDPKPNVSISQYSCFGNNPLLFSDVNGDSVWLYTTTLPGAPGILGPATHSFLVVKTSDNIIHYFVYGPEDDDAPMGGSPMVRKSFGDNSGGYSQDQEIIAGTNTTDLKEKFFILPVSMTVNEFDKKVISAANSYGNNPKFEYSAIVGENECEGNCNTATTTILSKAGVTDKTIKWIDKKTPGLNVGFGKKRPWTANEQNKAVETKEKRLEKEKGVLEEQNKMNDGIKF